MKIYKYPVPVADEFSIQVPEAARLLDVQVQRGSVQLWAMVAPDARMVTRKFALRGTGHDASGLGFAAHVGTFQLDGGALVFHLFDLGEA